MGADFWQQQQIEQERMYRAEQIFKKALWARAAGFFNDEDIADMKRELGLSTLPTHQPNSEH